MHIYHFLQFSGSSINQSITNPHGNLIASTALLLEVRRLGLQRKILNYQVFCFLLKGLRQKEKKQHNSKERLRKKPLNSKEKQQNCDFCRKIWKT